MLLSQAAKRRALKVLNRLAREDATVQARPAELREIEGRMARLESQVSAGVLERADVAAALEAFEERRKAIQAAHRRSVVARPGGELQSMERAWDAAVKQFRTLLVGSTAQARNAIHTLIGEVVCTPDAEGLVGKVKLNPVPLYQAAGVVSWIGSGGRI